MPHVDFSKTENSIIAKTCDSIRNRIADLVKDPTKVGLTEGEYPHIWARLKQIANMSREELIHEQEADYVLLGGCFSGNDPDDEPYAIPSQSGIETQE